MLFFPILLESKNTKSEKPPVKDKYNQNCFVINLCSYFFQSSCRKRKRQLSREKGWEKMLNRLYMDPKVQQCLSGATACHVASNIWLGDIGTAVVVAEGRSTHPFSAVFNASGIESKGITLEHYYTLQNIAYDTLMDTTNGITLGDGALDMPLEDIADEMVSNDDVHPTMDVIVRGTLVKAHKLHFSHGDFFMHMMVEAASRIERLAVRAGDGDVLVHCIAGRNRSAAAIVSYLILKLDYAPQYAIRKVKEASLIKRNISALTNLQYVRVLGDTSDKGIGAGAEMADAWRAKHDRTYKRLVSLAEEKAHLIKPPSSVGCRRNPLSFSLPDELERWMSVFFSTESDVNISCRYCGACCENLMRCSSCKTAYYCSVYCQGMDRGRHAIEDNCIFSR